MVLQEVSSWLQKTRQAFTQL